MGFDFDLTWLQSGRLRKPECQNAILMTRFRRVEIDLDGKLESATKIPRLPLASMNRRTISVHLFDLALSCESDRRALYGNIDVSCGDAWKFCC